MKLLVLLITLALRRLDIDWPAWLDQPHRVRPLLEPLQSRAQAWGLPDSLAWALVVVLPTALTVALFVLVQGWLWGLVPLLLGVALLLTLVGPRSEFRSVDELLLRGRMNDENGFVELAEGQFGVSGRPGESLYFERLMHAILHRDARFLFATVFYLATLGAGAAVLYVANRWLASREDAPGAELARTLDMALFWLPARLLIVALALAGHFGRVMDTVSGRLWQVDDSDTLLAEALAAALEVPDEGIDAMESGVELIQCTQSLLQRALALWLIMAAVWVVIAG